MSFEVRETLYIVVAIIAGCAFFLWFFYSPIRHFVCRHNLPKMFYHRVMKVARDGDYYLLNNLTLKIGGSDFVKIDHVLGGDKYLYVIIDHYYEGALRANLGDDRWVYYKRGGKKSEIPNPLFGVKAAMERLSIESGIASSFLVGICLINDDCFVNSFENAEGEVQFVPLSKLEKVIAAYEKKNVSPFVKKELWQTIHDLHELSEKNNAKQNAKSKSHVG